MSNEGQNTLICVGVVTGVRGLRGEVRLRPLTEDSLSVAEYGLLRTDRGQALTVTSATRLAKGLAVRFAEIVSREAAEALKGSRLFAERTALPELGEDEFYASDLVGLDVVSDVGEELGRVEAVANFGAGDLLEIALVSGDDPLLVPFHRYFVPTVDLAARRVVISPPPGLFERAGAPPNLGGAM